MAPQVQELSQAQALRALQLRPVRGHDQAELAAGGVPFELRTEAGRLVLVLDRRDSLLWVTAASGGGQDDMTRHGLEFVEQCAQLVGCNRVAFTTRRRGLVRKACSLGYVRDGENMQKVIQ